MFNLIKLLLKLRLCFSNLNLFVRCHVKGTCDFVGVNHYHTVTATNMDLSAHEPEWNTDQDAILGFDPSWPESVFELTI